MYSDPILNSHFHKSNLYYPFENPNFGCSKIGPKLDWSFEASNLAKTENLFKDWLDLEHCTFLQLFTHHYRLIQNQEKISILLLQKWPQLTHLWTVRLYRFWMIWEGTNFLDLISLIQLLFKSRTLMPMVEKLKILFS